MLFNKGNSPSISNTDTSIIQSSNIEAINTHISERVKAKT